MKQFLLRLSEWKLWDGLWALFVLILPLTSVPLIVRLVHSDVVAAPSALLLPFLLTALFIPFLIRRENFPGQAVPLILTVLMLLITTVFSFIYAIPDYKGNDPLRSSVMAVLTLFVGAGYYLVSLLRHKNKEKIRTTLDRKSTRLNSSHPTTSRMPSSA